MIGPPRVARKALPSFLRRQEPRRSRPVVWNLGDEYVGATLVVAHSHTPFALSLSKGALPSLPPTVSHRSLVVGEHRYNVSVGKTMWWTMKGERGADVQSQKCLYAGILFL